MNRALSLALSCLAALVLLAWGFHYQSFDLWSDELVSLHEYALRGWATTVATYPDPNNHILFNLLNGVALHLVGAGDIYQAMHHAPLLRWLQWLIALGTCAYVALTGWRFFSRLAGALSLAFLVTCLPFLNFSMQLRGYSLAMLFAAALLYHTWAAEERGSLKHLVLVSVAAFGILYSLPSNLYFVVAVGVLVAWRAVWPPSEPGESGTTRRRRELMVVGALITGVALALLAYVPVATDLLNNRFVQASPADRMFVPFHRLPEVAINLIAFRYLLLPICAAGFILAASKRDGRPSGAEKEPFLIGLLFLPFLFSFLRNGEPFQRTFLFIVPGLSVALGAGTDWLLITVRRQSIRALLAAAVALYAFGTLGFAYAQVQDRLADALDTGVKEQDLLANYYQFRGFQPSRVASELARVEGERPGSILLVDELDPNSLGYYLLDEDLGSLAILRIGPAARGESGTHVGLFQETEDHDSGIAYFQSSITLSEPLPEGNLLTPLLVVARSEKPPGIFYIVTAFAEKYQGILRTPALQPQTVFDWEGFTCWRINLE